MAPPDIRGLLTSFSPSSDFFAISSGDGRIKIWDTVKGQLQTEFSDIASSDESSFLLEQKRGHLSLDYTCMKWVQLPSKKKRKAGASILVLGTGSGDVLALDVSAGQLKWKVTDCHAGGVTAVSSSLFSSNVYTAGADGMVCQLDALTGSLLGRFRCATKSVSAMAVSSDGKVLATAAGQLKIFNCSDNKKIQKFTGHPVAVRSIAFTEDGKYILSSGVGERRVAIWNVGGVKQQPAVCILSMEHPAIFLDSRCVDNEAKDGTAIYILAISEAGVCYFWYGSNIEDLHNCQPTKILLPAELSVAKRNYDYAIFAAKLQDVPKVAFGQVLVACRSLVKPSFEKLMVQYGVEMKLESAKDGILLPLRRTSGESERSTTMQVKATALDRANAEDALLPLPKVHDQGKKRKHSMDLESKTIETLSNTDKMWRAVNKVNLQKLEEDSVVCIEDRLREVGLLPKRVDSNIESHPAWPVIADSDRMSLDKLSVDGNLPAKKIRAHISSLSSVEAHQFFETLLSAWKSRSISSKFILPYIYCILVKHGRYIISQESSAQFLDDLKKFARLRCGALESVAKLSGRFRLIMAQIDKSGNRVASDEVHDNGDKNDDDEDDDEDEEDDIDEMVYGEDDDGSQSDNEEDDQA